MRKHTKRGRRSLLLAVALAALAALGFAGSPPAAPRLAAPFQARASALGPTARTADGAVALVAPAASATFTDADTITFTWTDTLANTDSPGIEEFYLSDDSDFDTQTYAGRALCEQGAGPTCPTTVTIGPLPPGTYYWVVGLALYTEDRGHASDVASFTVTASPTPLPAVTPPTPHGGQVFSDPVNDGGAAPNITAVTVSNDFDNQISLNMFIAGYARPVPGELYFAYFDIDQDEFTGDYSSGSEYVIELNGDTNTFRTFRWDGEDFVSEPAASKTRVTNGAEKITISINARDLSGGKPLTGFGFWVGARRVTGPFRFYDWAPDYYSWHYELLAPAKPTPAAKLTAVTVQTLPSVPRGGLPFRILVPAVKVSTGLAPRPTKVTCSATVGGAPVKRSGVGGCTLTVPERAVGKTLVVRVTATYGGLKRVETRSYKVRSA